MNNDEIYKRIQEIKKEFRDIAKELENMDTVDTNLARIELNKANFKLDEVLYHVSKEKILKKMRSQEKSSGKKALDWSYKTQDIKPV